MLILLTEISFLDPTDFADVPDAPNDNSAISANANMRFIPESLGNFTEILDRPLLFESRRMPSEPKVAAAPAKPKAPLGLKLEGVAIRSDRRIALLRNTRDNQLLQLGEGMSYGGWTLQMLHISGAKFVRGEDVTEVNLETSTGTHGRRR
jgi:hypothetical protein